MIQDDNDDEYSGPDNRETTEYGDLSEIELQEMEEVLVRELWEEGLLRPRLVKPADQSVERDAPNDVPPDLLNIF